MKKIPYILFYILLIVFSVCATAQTDFVDDFDNNSNGWEELNNQKAHTKIKDGKYIINHKRRTGGWASSINVPVATAIDFKISTSLQKVFGVNNHGYGLIWGWKDAQNFNTFIISGDGNYSINYSKNGKMDIVVNWKLSPFINKRGGENELSIEKTGRFLIFSINGQQVEKLSFTPFSGEKMGFIVNRNQRIKIDYLKIRYLQNNSGAIDNDDRYTSFEVKNTEIDDGRLSDNTYGNANGTIEAGETVSATISIQNTGNRTEKNLWIWYEAVENYSGLTIAGSSEKRKLKTIAVNETDAINIGFFLSGIFKEKKIKMRITIENNLGEQIKKYITFDVGKAGTIQHTNSINTDPSVDHNIPETKNDGKNTYALIFGIANYKYAPKALFADRDAEIFYEYARKVFGIPAQNIYLRTNENASSGEFTKVFGSNGWLERRIKNKDDKVIVFFAGHGIPEIKNRSPYLMPYDADPAYSSTAFSLQGLYDTLSKLKSQNVTLFIDACFSGVNRGNQSLIEGNRAVKIRPASPLAGAGNLNVITACDATQYSGIYAEQQHGLFTYYLLRALRGDACGNDNKLLMNELFQYIKTNVNTKAIELNKEQQPTTNRPESKNLVLKF